MDRKNKGLIVLVIILTILVLGLGGYIVYDKVLSKNNDTNINNNDNDINNNNTDINNNVSNNNDNILDNNSENVVEENNSINNCYNFNVDYSKLTDMGTGIVIKNVTGYDYKLFIGSDGTLSYQNIKDGTKGIFDVSGVINVEYFHYAGEEKGEYFILKNDGTLYTITEKILSSGQNTLTEVIVFDKKIVKIGSFSTCKENAGCGWGVYAVFEDGTTKQLNFISV